MVAVYKCSLCGEHYRKGRSSSVLAQIYMNSLIVNGDQEPLEGFDGPIYHKSLHTCRNGSLGIGEIIGFETEE